MLARLLKREPIRYAMADPRQMDALRNLLTIQGRVAGLRPQGMTAPDLPAILSILTPLEQMLVIQMMAGGHL